MTNPMLIEEASGARQREPLLNRSPIAGPSDLFRVRDGWIMVQVIGNGMFARWAQLIGRADLISDPRFASDLARGENGSVLSEIMADWCAERTKDECLTELEKSRIPGCSALTPEAALSAPEIAGGGFFRSDPVSCGAEGADVNLPVANGAIRTAAGMANLGNAAPRLGADSVELLMQLGCGAEEIRKLTSPPLVRV